MTDEELREEIAASLRPNLKKDRAIVCPENITTCCNNCSLCLSEQILILTKKSGYRRLPEGEPPLLTDEKIREISTKIYETMPKPNDAAYFVAIDADPIGRAIAQAALNLARKFYRGE